MVEMLATLSIIGVLSVVGVAGYGLAMNRFRANELLNEAQKRAVMVAMQITSGKEMDALSVDEFPNPAGYTFGVEANPANPNQFNIIVSGVDTDVCQQMKNFVEDGSIIRTIDANCITLSFNNDLSKTTKTQCIDSGKVWCSETNYCSDSNSCCLRADCAVNTCPGDTATDNTGDGAGIFVGTSECKCPSGEVYLDGTCITKPTSCSSWITNECGKGYYCNFRNVGSLNEVSEELCYVGIEDVGKCTKISSESQPTANEMAILKQAGFKSTFLNTPSLNWWSASSWCVAHGRRLIDVKEMNCYRVTKKTETNNTLVQEGQGATYCCKKDEVCQQKTWDTGTATALWNNKVILDGKEEDVAKFSDKIVALRKVYGSQRLWLWSAQKYTSQISCFAFVADEIEGRAGSNTRRVNSYHGLCE